MWRYSQDSQEDVFNFNIIIDNCPQLEVLCLRGRQIYIKESDIKYLTEKRPNLKALWLETIIMSEKMINYIAQSLLKLCYVCLNNFDYSDKFNKNVKYCCDGINLKDCVKLID